MSYLGIGGNMMLDEIPAEENPIKEEKDKKETQTNVATPTKAVINSVTMRTI